MIICDDIVYKKPTDTMFLVKYTIPPFVLMHAS